jgi:hypothetical protein
MGEDMPLSQEDRVEMGMGSEEAAELGRQPRPGVRLGPEPTSVDDDAVGWKKVVGRKTSPPPVKPSVKKPEVGTIEKAVDSHFERTFPAEEGRDAILGSDLTNAVPFSTPLGRGRTRFNAAALRELTGGNIRNAIILKEIFDKPIALRNYLK